MDCYTHCSIYLSVYCKMSSSNSIYEFSKTVEELDWFEYGFIMLGVIFFVTQIMKPSWYFFLGLIFASGIIYFRIDDFFISYLSKFMNFKITGIK